MATEQLHSEDTTQGEIRVKEEQRERTLCWHRRTTKNSLIGTNALQTSQCLGTLPSEHPQRDIFLSEVDNSISAEFWEFSQASLGTIKDVVKGYSDST